MLLFTHKELSSSERTRPTVGVFVLDRTNALCFTQQTCHLFLLWFTKIIWITTTVSWCKSQNYTRYQWDRQILEVCFVLYSCLKMSPVPLNTRYRIQTGRPQTGIVHKLWTLKSFKRLTLASEIYCTGDTPAWWFCLVKSDISVCKPHHATETYRLSCEFNRLCMWSHMFWPATGRL